MADPQEQDIVERLLEPYNWRQGRRYVLERKAAQIIAALRAERDEQKQDACKWFSEALEQKQRAEAAEAHIKELEAEISNFDAELDHWSQLAVDDIGKNPPTSWKEIAETAIRERDELRLQAIADFGQIQTALEELDEARKALEDAATTAKNWLEDWGMDLQATCDAYIAAAKFGMFHGRKISPEIAKSSARQFKERSDAVYECGQQVAAAIRARLASSNREGGEE